MSQGDSAPPRFKLSEQRAGLGVLVAVVAVVGFGSWFLFDVHRNSHPAAATQTTLQAKGPVAMTPAELKTFAASLGHPLYWIGPRPNTTYELTFAAAGQTFVRYLPTGVAIGSKQPYLTVATYPQVNAFLATSSAIGSGDVSVKIPNGGIAEYPKGEGTNIHLAFPGADVQIEVYDPSAAVALQLVTSGAVVSV